MDFYKKTWLNLFARQRFGKLNKSLLRRGLAGLGIDDYGPRSEKGERRLLMRLTQTLPQNGIVYDVGAYKGSYACYLAASRPDLIIHGFEPNPKVIEELTVNARGRFAIHSFALGDQECEANLYDPDLQGGSEGASLIEAAVDAIYKNNGKRLLPIHVKTLDKVSEGLGTKYIDYLKIDTEGYDYKVLRGGAKLIKEDRLGIIQFEFNTMNVFSRIFMYDFYQILPRHRFYRIVQDGLVSLGEYNSPTVELFGYQNIVAFPNGQTPLT
ncbi:MAG: FkbM family methyltransferase [Alphaproteobacteria bacterium]